MKNVNINKFMILRVSVLLIAPFLLGCNISSVPSIYVYLILLNFYLEYK